MQDLWLLKLDAPNPALVQALQPSPQLRAWQAIDAPFNYLYLPVDAAAAPPSAPAALDWHRLECVQAVAGASPDDTPRFHYVVETNVLAQAEEDLNAWYAQEHLPGLAAVPGVVRAARYVDARGSPRYYACYDLAQREAFGSPQWLAVRGTAWSSRVRPAFRDTRRTMFQPA